MLNLRNTSIPFTTKLIMLACFALYLLSILYSEFLLSACVSVDFVRTAFLRDTLHGVLSSEFREIFRCCCFMTVCCSTTLVHRLLSSHFFHFGFFHLLFNMFAFTGPAQYFETKLGSVQAMFMVLLMSLFASSLHLLLQLAIETLPSGFYLLRSFGAHSCTLGLSGTIFTLMVVQCHDQSIREQYLSYELSIFAAILQRSSLTHAPLRV